MNRWATRIDNVLAPPMFVASIGFLIMLGSAVQASRHGAVLPHVAQLHLSALFMFWPVFLAELLVRLALRCPRWKQYVVFALVPPLRMGARDQATGQCIWLPRLEWQRCDREFRQRAERGLSLPMMLVALLVLPVLAIEFFWHHEALMSPALSFLLDAGTSIIWLAFAIEFILMVSITDKRLKYCRTHWIDLAIILLPFLAFLRMLRLGQLMRLLRVQQVGRLSRAYRLRGFATRAYRGILVLNVIRYFVRVDPQKRMEALQELVREKQYELDDLLTEIRKLEAECAAAARPSETPPPQAAGSAAEVDG